MTQVYFSPFFPDPATSGTKGSTVPVVTTVTIGDITTDIAAIDSRVTTLETTAGDTIAPDPVAGLALATSLAVDSDGSQIVTLTATWTASAATDLNGYELAIQENGGVFVEFAAGKTTTTYYWKVRAGQSFGVKIRAVDTSGNRSTYSSTVTLASATDTTPPAAASTFTVTAGFTALYLSWTNPADADVAEVLVYENTTNNSGTASIIGTVNAVPNQKGAFSRTGLSSGSLRYYWLKVRDTSGNLSAFSAVASGTTASLILPDFTPGLAPIESVAALPSTGNFQGRTVMLQSDGKLYRWNSTTTTGTSFWTAAVPAVDLTGQITGTQITNGSITTPKIATGAVTANEIAAATITGDRLVAGTIQAAQIAAGAITASKLKIQSEGSALNSDPGFTDSSAWSLAGMVLMTGLTDGKVGTTSARTTIPGSDSSLTGQYRIPVDPNKTYRVRCWARTVSGTGSIAYPSVAALFDSANVDIAGDGSLWFYPFPAVTVPNTWTEYSAVFGYGTGRPFPSNARTMSPTVLGGFGGGSSIHEFQDLRIEEVLPGTLIQDGSITTAKIIAGAITADKIQAGTITGDKFSTGTSLPGTITVGASGVTIATILAGSANGGLPNLVEIGGPIYTIVGNKVTRAGTTNDWLTNVYTRDSFYGYARISGKLDNINTFIGLSTTQSGNYTNINYSIHRSTSQWYVYQLGSSIINFGSAYGGVTFTNNTIWTVEYSGTSVKYYADGVLLYTTIGGDPPNLRVYGAISIFAMGSIVSDITINGSYDPAASVNVGNTQIDPGKIVISGATTLSDWRQGGDTTKIAGGSISANTISANKLNIGNRNLQFRDIEFFINAAGTTLSWTSGYIFYVNDAGTTVYNFIPSGSTSPAAGTYVYIYWSKPSIGFQVDNTTVPFVVSTSHYAGLGPDEVQVANWQQGTKVLVQNFGGTIVDGDKITTGTITASKLNVSTLSAITANIGLLRTATSGARMEIESNQLRSYDSAGTMRVRLGVW